MKPALLEIVNVYREYNLFKFFDEFREDFISTKSSLAIDNDKSFEILEKIISGTESEKENSLQDLIYFSNDLFFKYHVDLEEMWNFFNKPNSNLREEAKEMLMQCARVSDIEDIDIIKNIVRDYLKQESYSHIKRNELLKPIDSDIEAEKEGPNSIVFPTFYKTVAETSISKMNSLRK